MRKLFFKSMLLLCALIVGSGVVWATTYVGTFNKITSLEDFTTGYYVITSSESATTTNKAMGPAVSSGRVTGITVEISSNTISNPDNSIVYYIVVSEGKCTMKNVSTNKYLYQSGTTNGKGMNFVNDATEITITGYNSNAPKGFKFTLNGNSNNIFKWNNSNNWFANYTGSYTADMTPVTLYQLDAGEATKVTINDSKITNTDLAAGAVAGSLSAVVTYGSPEVAVPNASVTWTSSETGVATIANNGAITLVGKGTTTITARYAGDPGNFKASSKTYDLTVTNTHTASFSVNGVINSANNKTANQGESITFPSNPSSIGGKDFVGWSNTPVSLTDEAPSLVTTASEKMGTSDITYYAVFAKTEAEESDLNMTIGTNTANFPDSYGTANTFTEYTLNGKKFKIQQAYVNGTKLQWRAAGNSSGTGTMYNTQSLGKIKSIVLTYDNSDLNKNFTISVGDSENPSTGTDITPSISTNVYTFDCSSLNKSYFVMTNGSGAGYLSSIKINYTGSVETTKGYCTSVTIPVSTLPNRNYGTYVPEYKLDFGSASGITAYIATGLNGSGNAVVLHSVNIVPAHEPIIIKTDEKGDEVEVPVTIDEADDEINNNMLLEGDGSAYNADPAYNFYFLANDQFHLANDGYLQPGKAYLMTDSGSNAPSLRITFEENNATNIESIDATDGTVKFIENGQLFIKRDGIVYDALGRKIR